MLIEQALCCQLGIRTLEGRKRQLRSTNYAPRFQDSSLWSCSHGGFETGTGVLCATSEPTHPQQHIYYQYCMSIADCVWPMWAERSAGWMRKEWEASTGDSWVSSHNNRCHTNSCRTNSCQRWPAMAHSTVGTIDSAVVWNCSSNYTFTVITIIDFRGLITLINMAPAVRKSIANFLKK